MPPRPTLFISYRRAQLARVAPVVSALRAANIDCFLDVNDIDPLAAFPETIRAGIDRSHALLAWWSLDYTESDHCLQEFRRAWQHARRHSSILERRIWVLNPETAANHISAGELNAEIYLKPADHGAETAWANDLLQRLHVLLPEGTLADERTQQPLPSMYGVPTKSNEFTGRGRELMSIHSKLHPAQIGSTGAAVAVQTHGMGGIGKTELATAYASDFAMAYPGGIYWLNLAGWTLSNPAREDEAQPAWLRALEQTIGLDTERVRNLTRDPEGRALPPDAVRERLAKELGSDSHYLWILDNVPELTPLDVRARILGFFRAPSANGRTLLTTRDGRVADGFAQERLDVLSEDDAIRLLATFRQRQAHAELGAIRNLVQEVGAHTQALILLGENARNNFGGYPRVLERLLKTGSLDRIEQIAAHLKGQLGTKARGIVATFELSIDPLGPSAKELLSFASVCAPNLAIPDTLLADAFGDNAREDDFGAALSELLRASLLTRRSDKGGAVFIHPLVESVANWLLKPDELTLRQRVADMLLGRIATSRDIRTHSAVADDIRQARELAPLLEGRRGVEILLWLGTYEQNRGNLTEAGVLGAQCLALAERVLGAEDPNTLTAMSSLAVTLQSQGHFGGARVLHEQVLPICHRVFGEEHPVTLTSMNLLARTFQAQGDNSGARALQEQALRIRRRVFGDDHADTLTATLELAGTLHAQGDLSGARALQEQVLSIRRRILGGEDPDTTASAWNVFLTFCALKDLVSARALLDRDLLWLSERDPATLNADQRKIREYVLRLTKR
jgi:hypothetical protein